MYSRISSSAMEQTYSNNPIVLSFTNLLHIFTVSLLILYIRLVKYNYQSSHLLTLHRELLVEK